MKTMMNVCLGLAVLVLCMGFFLAITETQKVHYHMLTITFGFLSLYFKMMGELLIIKNKIKEEEKVE